MSSLVFKLGFDTQRCSIDGRLAIVSALPTRIKLSGNYISSVPQSFPTDYYPKRGTEIRISRADSRRRRPIRSHQPISKNQSHWNSRIVLSMIELTWRRRRRRRTVLGRHSVPNKMKQNKAKEKPTAVSVGHFGVQRRRRRYWGIAINTLGPLRRRQRRLERPRRPFCATHRHTATHWLFLFLLIINYIMANQLSTASNAAQPPFLANQHISKPLLAALMLLTIFTKKKNL